MTDHMRRRKALFESLGTTFAAHGFKLKASKASFLRKRNGVTDMFQVLCLDGKPGWRIHPEVGVRIERVEAIFHQTSGSEPKYQKDTPTIGGGVGNITDGSNRAFEFRLEHDGDLPLVVENITHAFDQFALPYFETFGSVSAIDKELNSNPTERTPNRGLPWLRCSTGAIVAKLSGRSDYGELVRIYTDQMRRVSNGFYLARFEALLRSLEAVQPEAEPAPGSQG